MATQRKTPEHGNNVVQMRPRDVMKEIKLAPQEEFRPKLEEPTAYIVRGGCMRVLQTVHTTGGSTSKEVNSYQSGEYFYLGGSIDENVRLVADDGGSELFGIAKSHFEQLKDPSALLAAVIQGGRKHDERQQLLYLDALRDLDRVSRDHAASHSRSIGVAVDAANARQLLADAHRKIADLSAKTEELEAKLENEVNEHLVTRQNLDSTTSQLNKSAESNQQLRKMLPDVLEMVEIANTESRRQAERFPEELNKILAAYNLPPRTPDQIMNMLWKLDRGEKLDPVVDLGFAQLDIEIEEDEPITVSDAELLEDGDRHTIPILEPPPSFEPSVLSQIIVSSGRTLPSGELIGTRQGVGERRKPILSTQQYPAPKLGPVVPKK